MKSESQGKNETMFQNLDRETMENKHIILIKHKFLIPSSKI